MQLAVLLDCNLGAIGACQVVIRLASKHNMRCALGEVITASVEATGLILPWIIGANYQRLFPCSSASFARADKSGRGIFGRSPRIIRRHKYKATAPKNGHSNV